MVESASKRFLEGVSMKMDKVAAMNFSAVDWIFAVKVCGKII